jgi:hypothetical protein
VLVRKNNMSVDIIHSFFRDDDSGYLLANPDGTFSLFYKVLYMMDYEFVITAGYFEFEDAIDDFNDLYNGVSWWQGCIGVSKRI